MSSPFLLNHGTRSVSTRVTSHYRDFPFDRRMISLTLIAQQLVPLPVTPSAWSVRSPASSKPGRCRLGSSGSLAFLFLAFPKMKKKNLFFINGAVYVYYVYCVQNPDKKNPHPFIHIFFLENIHEIPVQVSPYLMRDILGKHLHHHLESIFSRSPFPHTLGI